MKKKKIGVLHSGNLGDVSPGGVSEYVSQFIKFSENDVVLFGTEEKKNNIKLFKKYKRNIDGREYIYIPINYSNKRPISIYFFINFIYFILTNPNFIKKISIFYAQRMEYVLPFTILYRKKSIAMAVHGSGKYATMFWGKWIAKLYGILEKISIGRADKVLVLNNNRDFGLEYYKKMYLNQRAKINYAPVPVNQDLFKPLNKLKVREKHNYKSDDNIILFLGRLDHNPKRIFLLPEILQKVQKQHPNTKMLIIGSGKDKDDLIKMFEDRNLKSNIKIYDYLKHGDTLVELINCANVSIISSKFEGICMAALESLSCNVPVVATDVGSIKDYLENNVNGYLIVNNENEIINKSAEYISSIFKQPLIMKEENIKPYSAKEVIKNTEQLLVNSGR